MIDVASLRARLDGVALGSAIRALSSVTSTSDIAWAWADAGCPEGTVVFAEEQVTGRGRFGRRWECPRGDGLLMSVVLRPRDGAVGPAHLTAAAALATAEAAAEVAGVDAAIRWPNDVIVGGRKLAGVLVERRGGEGLLPCVLGIGLNVNVSVDRLPDALRGIATSLRAEAGRSFELEAVAAAVLRRLDARYREAGSGGWEGVAAAWRGRCGLVGETIAVDVQGERVCGIVVGVDALAGLELELAGGARRVCRPEVTSLVLTRAAEAG